MKDYPIALPWIDAGIRAGSEKVPAGFDGLAATSVAAAACTCGASLLVGWMANNPANWMAATLAAALSYAATWMLLAWRSGSGPRRSGGATTSRRTGSSRRSVSRAGRRCWWRAQPQPPIYSQRGNLDAALALVDDGDVGPSLAGIVSPTMGAIALAGAMAVAVSTFNRLWFAPVGSAVQALTVSAVVGTVGLALVNRPDLLLASTSPNGATAVTWGASAVRGLPLVALVALSLRLERVRRAPARSPHGGGSAPL